MSYIIEPMPLITFLDEKKLKLPRFQRKATWTKKQNFELAISVFQDYPVGVVIVNQDKSNSWLLDGRQRRNALKIMRENPVELYDWAINYIGFKKTADPNDVSDAYWSKVEKYLQAEEPADKKEEDADSAYGGEEEEKEENSFDIAKQRKGLQLLLNLILMVHQKKSGISRWERTFDFSKYFKRLKYFVSKDNPTVNPLKLREFILELVKTTDDGVVSEDFFVEYYNENFDTDDLNNFKIAVNNKWDEIIKSIEYISESEKIFSEARIGIIKLTNASPLDAQNIFSRINKGGTQLKAEELLSAKPYWNKEVNIYDINVINLVKDMYNKIDIPMIGKTVRWDIAATLLSRIKDGNLIFDSYDDAKSKNEISLDQVTLGFKLASSIYNGGMSAKHVIEIEKEDKIAWDFDIDNLVADLNTICNILEKDEFFGCLLSWKYPIANLLGNAIALEFITIIYKDWVDKNKPTVASSELKAFCRNSRILFDRLVFEYTSKSWRGSGDSKMANDIKNWKERFNPIAMEDWLKLIESCFEGSINGQATSVKVLRPILYYYYATMGTLPINKIDVSFDVDHIIPQDSFNGVSVSYSALKDSLGNLALLPTKSNISKKDKMLSDISDAWLKKQIEIYTGISCSEFEQYSNVTKVSSLKAERYALFDNGVNNDDSTFIGKRKILLAN